MQLDGPDYPAPAKLNLFLHVVGRRADGYHLLQSAFTLIDAADRLRFALRADGEIHRVSELPGVPAEADLVVRAARLLKSETGSALGAAIEVDKRLPLGGGVGGGSSDAATTLLVLNRLWAPGSTGRPSRPWVRASGPTCLSSSSAAMPGWKAWAKSSRPWIFPRRGTWCWCRRWPCPRGRSSPRPN